MGNSPVVCRGGLEVNGLSAMWIFRHSGGPRAYGGTPDGGDFDLAARLRRAGGRHVALTGEREAARELKSARWAIRRG